MTAFKDAPAVSMSTTVPDQIQNEENINLSISIIILEGVSGGVLLEKASQVANEG